MHGGTHGSHVGRRGRRRRRRYAIKPHKRHNIRRESKPRMIAIIAVCAVSCAGAGAVCALATWINAHTVAQAIVRGALTMVLARGWVAVKDCITFCWGKAIGAIGGRKRK
jgi:hypothetical protein